MELPLIYMPSGNIASLSQGLLPPLYLVLPLFFIRDECFAKAASLFTNIRWIHMVEYREYHLPRLLSTIHNLCKLIQTPPWISIIFGESNNGKSRFFNSFKKLGLNLFSPPESVITDSNGPRDISAPVYRSRIGRYTK